MVRGEVQEMGQGVLTLKTGFAGSMEIAMDQVAGVRTDQEMVLVLHNGDAVRGTLDYDPETGMRIASPLFGETAILPAQLAAICAPGALTPAQEKLAALRAAEAHRWAGQLQIGLTGNSGNSDANSVHFGAKAKRSRGDERLFLSLLVHKAEQEDKETADETIASVRLERNFTPRFFAFAQTEGEHDEFENIDFRSTTTLGPGYYLLQGEHQELKARLGFGYEYIAPVAGTNISELVLTLGYDYLVDVPQWFRFSHNLTVIPRITDDPGDNYRVDSTFGIEAPLGKASLWSLLAQLRHEYTHSPDLGVEELDSTWLLTLVRDFD